MPFNGSGTFQRVMNWVNDAAANIKIKADRHDQEDDNFASGLSMCITKDGQTTITADIPMNNKKLTGLAAPTVSTDAVNKTYADTYNKKPSVSNYFASDAAVVIPAGATEVWIEAVGGGGGGGGVTPSGAGTFAAGGGGGAGAYGIIGPVVLGASPSVAVVIGAGGIGIAAAQGTAGSMTRVTVNGTDYDCNGGSGGLQHLAVGATNGLQQQGGNGGNTSNIIGAGQKGENSFFSPACAVAGSGGSSLWGRGGLGARATSVTLAGGAQGQGNGAGGAGAISFAGVSGNQKGGDGSDGRVRLTWHFGR